MKKILLIGQLTDISGYGNAVRCYMKNLVELEQEGLIELKVLNYSFEEASAASEQELEDINKRSLTQNINHWAGSCTDEDEYNRIQEYMNGRDYEVIFYLTCNMLQFGHDNDSSKFEFYREDRPDISGPRINLKEICKHSSGVYPCIAWESETIPVEWQNSLNISKNKIKKLLCACDWNRDIFAKTGIPATTIPYSVEFEQEYEEEYYEKIKEFTKDTFVFSSVFQWSDRKGVDVLIKAFALEFATNSDVSLVLKTYMNKAIKGAQKNEDEIFRQLIENINSRLLHLGQRFIPKYKIIIINELLTKKQLNSIYKASDAFILPTRGEGFCLPVAEAISYEKPAIVPNIGGHLGYMDRKESEPFLIDSRMEPCESMTNPIWSSLYNDWVEPSLKSTREKIRMAYENKSLCVRLGKKQNITMSKYLSKERCVNLFKQHLFEQPKQAKRDNGPRIDVSLMTHEDRLKYKIGERFDMHSLDPIHYFLQDFCQELDIKSYFEVGTSEGKSLKEVIKHSKSLERVGSCDIWGTTDGGTGRGSHQHVADLVESLGYKGEITFYDGDSHKILPTLMHHEDHFEKYDLVLVDGDHTLEGNRQDLIECWPMVKPGGWIIFDDITHPKHLFLEEVFDIWVEENKDNIEEHRKYKDHHGWGIAKKKIK
jgi:glycosyltransferase involved in cell wall biosynthesis